MYNNLKIIINITLTMFKEYNGYRINEDGVILGISGKIIKGTKNSKGYLQTTGKNKKKILIHRLIAQCWIECPGDFCSYQVALLVKM